MNFDLLKLVRPNVLKLKPYSSARDDFKGSASIFLDANENPFPNKYNRYPDPHQYKLKERISELKKIKAEQIFLGNGSDEAIDLLCRAFCEPGVDNVLIPQPTYGMYAVSADINAVEIISGKLTKDFDLDLDAIKNQWNPNTKLIFLCSPNNPSGNLLSVDKIKNILGSFNGLVIVDEAYLDFTSYEGFVPLLNKYPNLVILQTLSKAWGLANIRLGMCFASTDVIAILNKIKPPYNINGITQQIALENLQQVELKNKWVEEIINEREHLRSEFLKIPSIKRVYPSEANFLLVQINDAQKIYQQLIVKGIVLRDRSNVILCEDCLRITVGTPMENKELLLQLNQL